MRIMVWALLLTASFGNRFRAFHHKCATHRTECPRWPRLDGMFALGIVGTRPENTETPLALYHLSFAANIALHSAGIKRVQVGILFDVLTLWIVCTRNKSAELSLAFDKITLKTVGTLLACGLRSFDFFSVDTA